jgi:hypothetical protein
VVVAVARDVMSGQPQSPDGHRLTLVQRDGRAQRGVRGQEGAGLLERPFVAVGVIGVTVGIDDVGNRQTLCVRALDEYLWGVRGINEHALTRVAVAKHVTEVAITAGANLLEDE